MNKRLPIGIDNFEKLIRNDFYYVDKTLFIKDLIGNLGEVNLFTRPRRFGKTLNMTMLRSFFDIQSDRKVFSGLNISNENEICNKYQCRYPVIYISLKSVDGFDFKSTLSILRQQIGELALNYNFLENSPKLSDSEKNQYRKLLNFLNNDCDEADLTIVSSIKTLSRLLSIHYEKRVIILIDEYDVPLDKAFNNGYYDQMVVVIRNLFDNALKSNDYLEFAVLTGCLRISKESIFTGFNNLKCHTISDVRFDEYFGFTETDVITLLKDYDLSDKYEEVKRWYDGYRFGAVDVYCPWDVLNYCDEVTHNPNTIPKNYWANTSSNELIAHLLNNSGQTVRDDLEKLISGESIHRKIREDLTYNEIDFSNENIWSILYSTGYLTIRENFSDEKSALTIPNEEIRNIFIDRIVEWFDQETKLQHKAIDTLCTAFVHGDADKIQNVLQSFLWKTISVRDGAVRNELKENFYHGWLLGILSSQDNWSVFSNRESGDGYSDIVVVTPERIGFVIEVKYAHDGELIAASNRALKQINEKRYYDLNLPNVSIRYRYGISFYAKDCFVVVRSLF